MVESWTSDEMESLWDRLERGKYINPKNINVGTREEIKEKIKQFLDDAQQEVPNKQGGLNRFSHDEWAKKALTTKIFGEIQGQNAYIVQSQKEATKKIEYRLFLKSEKGGPPVMVTRTTEAKAQREGKTYKQLFNERIEAFNKKTAEPKYGFYVDGTASKIKMKPNLSKGNIK